MLYCYIPFEHSLWVVRYFLKTEPGWLTRASNRSSCYALAATDWLWYPSWGVWCWVAREMTKRCFGLGSSKEILSLPEPSSWTFCDGAALPKMILCGSDPSLGQNQQQTVGVHVGQTHFLGGETQASLDCCFPCRATVVASHERWWRGSWGDWERMCTGEVMLQLPDI